MNIDSKNIFTNVVNNNNIELIKLSTLLKNNKIYNFEDIIYTIQLHFEVQSIIYAEKDLKLNLFERNLEQKRRDLILTHTAKKLFQILQNYISNKESIINFDFDLYKNVCILLSLVNEYNGEGRVYEEGDNELLMFWCSRKYLTFLFPEDLENILYNKNDALFSYIIEDVGISQEMIYDVIQKYIKLHYLYFDEENALTINKNIYSIIEYKKKIKTLVDNNKIKTLEQDFIQTFIKLIKILQNYECNNLNLSEQERNFMQLQNDYVTQISISKINFTSFWWVSPRFWNKNLQLYLRRQEELKNITKDLFDNSNIKGVFIWKFLKEIFRHLFRVFQYKNPLDFYYSYFYGSRGVEDSLKNVPSIKIKSGQELTKTYVFIVKKPFSIVVKFNELIEEFFEDSHRVKNFLTEKDGIWLQKCDELIQELHQIQKNAKS